MSPVRRQASMLQHIARTAALSAAHQLAAVGCDLVGARHFETGRGDIRPGTHVTGGLVN